MELPGPLVRLFSGSNSPPNTSDISKMVPSPTEEFLSARDNVWIPKCTIFGYPTRMKMFNTVKGSTYGSSPLSGSSPQILVEN